MPTKKTTTKRSSKKTAKKKTAAKKTVAKKRARRTPAKRVLICANDDHCFWAKDGQILSDLAELRDALQKMSDATFAYHVNKEKNDFADWVEAVLDDKQLADALRRSRKQKTARAAIVRRLKVYEL